MKVKKTVKAKAKKSKKTGTTKKTSKKGVKKENAKDSRKKATTKKTTTKKVIRIKDVRKLIDYCKQLFGREPFKGVAIDFHSKKPSFIFIPTEVSVAKVSAEELLDYLQKKGVQRVLIDALNKKRVPILLQLCKAGIEVYVLRRPIQIERMRRELRNRNIEVPKSDKYDAVLLAFTPPKKWTKVDAKFLKSWEAMVEWRNAETSFRIEQQRYNTNNSEGPKEDEEDEELRRIYEMIQAKLVEAQRLLEEVQKLEAQLFILKVQKHYNVTEEDFQELGIETNDTVVKAYACEAILEAIHCDTLVGFINKAGIRLSKKGRRPFVHDGRLSHAIHQLAVKVYHLDMSNQRGKIRYKKLQWPRRSGSSPGESLRIKETVGWGKPSGPDLPKREGSGNSPRPSGRDLRKQGLTW
jgi:hypothetical protein